MAEGSIAADELRLLIERIERLEEEKKAIADDVKDVYGEAKSRGYDTKTIRAIVRLHKMESHVRQEAGAPSGARSKGDDAKKSTRARCSSALWGSHTERPAMPS